MKILVILVVFAICSTTLAQSSDGRKPKRKLKKEPVRGERHYEFPGLLPGPFGERHPGIQTKPRIPYVDEETSANNVTGTTEYHGHRYKEVQKGPHVGVDEHSRHIGDQGRHVGIDQQDRHVGNQEGRHVGDQQGLHVGDQQGRHGGVDRQSRHGVVDQQSHHGGVEQQSRHAGVGQQGRHVGIYQQGRHVGNQEGRHGGLDRQSRHGVVDQQSHHGGVDQQSRHAGVGQQGRHVGVKQDSRHADTKQRGRQTRQSHNTFLTVQVPPVGSLLGGTQGSFQSGILSPFPGGSHAGNHPGNQGGFVIPGGVVFLGSGGSGGSHGGSGGYRPDPLASIGLNGNFPFNPDNPTGGSPGTSSAGGPGGLSSGSESGLAGGLGGVYGAGYGFGLGGLIFGGPNGPVFAGNAALGEGFSGSPEGALANEEFEEPDKQNAVQTPKIPAFRLMPSRSNSFEVDKAKAYTLANRGVTGTYPKVQHPNGNGRTLSPTSNSGETVGYVAFIFPKRNFQRQNPKALQFPSHPGTMKSPTDASASKPKTEAASVATRPAPTFLPVPVHIPIDRPYPVLVPKPYPVEVLKPYPVAVPIREPVPYEVARPIRVPVAVPAEVTRPAESPYLAGVNGVGSFVLQPLLETSILHKRSDKIDVAKPA